MISTLDFCISLALFASLVGNGALFLLRKRKPKPTASIEARDLLHDLTRRGSAIVRIQVIDAENLLLRSPRG